MTKIMDEFDELDDVEAMLDEIREILRKLTTGEYESTCEKHCMECIQLVDIVKEIIGRKVDEDD